MTGRPIRRAVVALGVTCVWGSGACGQCQNLRWTGEFAPAAAGLVRAGFPPLVAALRVFDPEGPMSAELYVGGRFDGAAGVASPVLMRWDGHRWAGVGGVITGTGALVVTGLALHDPDGAGPLAPVLVVAGRFSSAGGVAVANVASWDGVQWSAMGSAPGTSHNVAMVDFDEDGPGLSPSYLYLANGSTMLRWDGVQWTAVPTPEDPRVMDLEVFDEDGPGPLPPRLFAATAISFFAGIYRWDGAVWTVVGGGLSTRSANHRCSALLVADEDGPGPGGPSLLVGGSFNTAGEVPALNIARWDGQAWSAVASGIDEGIEDIIAVNDGSGAPTLFAAGNGWTVSTGVHRLPPGSASWERIGVSDASAGASTLMRLAAFVEPGAASPAVYYAGAGLQSVDGVPSSGIARFGCACYANCDGSAVGPMMNVLDFGCFLNRFAAGEAYANCDGSTGEPVLNVLDFSCYLNRFAAGCS